MKNFYFLVSLPRAGNTLFGTLINQNLNVCCTGNSIILDLLWQNECIKSTENYRNIPDENAIHNVQKNIIHNYYKDYKANTIIDRSPWATPINYKMLTDYITPNPKFIILYRPMAECFASFMKTGAYKNEDDMMNHLMDTQGFMNMAYTSIVNVLQSNNNYLFLTYKDLINQSAKTIKKVFSFIGEDYKPIVTKNFEQFNANGIAYNDSVLFSDHHTIRTDKIKKLKINVADYISNKTIAKSKEWDKDLITKLNTKTNKQMVELTYNHEKI